MSNKDKSMMAISIATETSRLFADFTCDHPLDSEVTGKIKALHDLIRDDDDDYEIFRHSAKTDELWGLLLSKAIRCLRYFDEREPFITNHEKKPKAYGLEELNEYYVKYKEFERMLYGSGQYYRDHVVHVFRTWLTGIDCLVKNGGVFLKFISILEDDQIKLNAVEKISIWTIIALTHDLGYPLEKAKGIIDTTRSMVSTFVANPDISMDLSFHGVQNYMNDFIVRLMSSKMVYTRTQKGKGKMYVARLQPKYYFKFQKSLEKTSHGIISTLIIYKLLTYFLESDYNINEDYKFNREERRQFYIRREILRAIASHTCTDVYHLYMGTFAFLLIIADDTQEWGRKFITELYISSGDKYEPGEIDLTFSQDSDSPPHKCKISEKMIIPERKGAESVIRLMKRLKEQALTYVTIFRDGQDTDKRDFSFERRYRIEYNSSPKISFDMILDIAKDRPSSLSGKIEYKSDETKNEIFNQTFIERLQKELDTSVVWKVFDDNGTTMKEDEPATWRRGEIVIDLAN
jgi:hypothetical protein